MDSTASLPWLAYPADVETDASEVAASDASHLLLMPVTLDNERNFRHAIPTIQSCAQALPIGGAFSFNAALAPTPSNAATACALTLGEIRRHLYRPEPLAALPDAANIGDAMLKPGRGFCKQETLC